MGVGGPCLPSLESPPSLGSQRSPFAALPSQEQWKGLRQGGSAHPLPQPVQQNHLRNGIWGGSRGVGGRREDTEAAASVFLPALGTWGLLWSRRRLGCLGGIGPSGWVPGCLVLDTAWGALAWVPGSSFLGCGHIQRASRGLAGSTEVLVLWTPQEASGGCEVLCNAGRPRESSLKSVPAYLQPLSQHRFYPVPNSLDFSPLIFKTINRRYFIRAVLGL